MSADAAKKIVLEEGNEYFPEEVYCMIAQVRRFGSVAAGSLNHQQHLEQEAEKFLDSMRLVA